MPGPRIPLCYELRSRAHPALCSFVKQKQSVCEDSKEWKGKQQSEKGAHSRCGFRPDQFETHNTLGREIRSRSEEFKSVFMCASSETLTQAPRRNS